MAKLTYLDIVRSQRIVPAPVVKADLTGKTVVVTGANVGIGLEAAKHFASMNPARLILACRNEEKGTSALTAVEQETGYKSAELWLVDLGNFSSVIAFADRFERDGGRLDILVANAAVAQMKYATTVDGWEETVQVNHLSTALLSLLLLPRMLHAASQGSTPRLVIVSSGAHYLAKFDEEDISLEKSSDDCKKSMEYRYLHSKILNILFVRALQSHLPTASPIIVNAVSPGYCVSQLRRHWSFPKAQIDKITEWFLAFTSEEGSRQLIWAAVGGSGREEELKGGYISGSDICEPSDFVTGDTGKRVQERAWDETIAILSNVTPKVTQILEG